MPNPFATLFLILFLLLVLAGLAFAGVVAWLYGWLIARAQPKHDGVLAAACFEQPVEVLRTIHSFDPCLACAVHIHDEHGSTVHRLETF